MLSEKSIGFMTLFEACKDEVIKLEGISHQTLSNAFKFCHGEQLKELNNKDAFSLLFFSDAWEIAELKVSIVFFEFLDILLSLITVFFNFLITIIWHLYFYSSSP